MSKTKNIIDYLKANHHRPVKVDELADVACLSKVQLFRTFKSETGITPVQYHEYLRIMKSTELLQSDAQVRQVAYQLGYENYETFSRAFKKLMEISPSDMQTIYYRFADQANLDYALVVKEQASLQQIDDKINESFGDKRYELDLEIYRLSFETKKKWMLHRDQKTEDAIRGIDPKQ